MWIQELVDVKSRSHFWMDWAIFGGSWGISSQICISLLCIKNQNNYCDTYQKSIVTRIEPIITSDIYIPNQPLVASFSASLSHFQQANSCHVFFDARSVSVLLAGHFQEGLLISAARSPCPPSHLACRACSWVGQSCSLTNGNYSRPHKCLQ